MYKKSLFEGTLLCVMLLFLVSSVHAQSIVTGAERTNIYLPLLQDKKVAIVANPTSIVLRDNHTNIHLVDTLLSRGVNVVSIFCPEHGFRGQAEAGASINSEVDARTKLPIVSLYGRNKKPTAEQLKGIEVMIFDLQDVGCRFYTYISTLHYVMEACAEQHIMVIVLDRPNPNGHYVDGPVLDMKYQSFVGMHPVPIVYGMTIGEYAQMINGEYWLKDSLQCSLVVVPLQNYTHASHYSLPVAPSPNLQTDQAIALYPNLCLFEGTSISVGRGTSWPFEVVGSFNFKSKDFSFTPHPIKGVSENPPCKNQKCYGLDLRKVTPMNKFSLKYLITLYQGSKSKETFFLKSNFFEKLAGNGQLRHQIQQGLSEEEIRATWQPALDNFKQIRQRYLLYL